MRAVSPLSPLSPLSRLSLLLVGSASLAIASHARAQSAAPRVDSLPVELVDVLLQPYGGSQTHEYFIGRVPPVLDRFFYVPRNARVLGGMSSFSGVTVVLDLPPGSEDAATMYQREMPKLGWTPPSPTAGRTWGFVPAPGTTMNGSLEFCHIGQSIQIRPFPNGSGGTRITATVQPFGSQCSDSRPNVMAVGEVPSLPTLANPTGSAMNSPSCASPPFVPTRSSGTSERVQTTLAPDRLLEFFGKQLADSGWTPSQAGAVARRTWTRRENSDTREVTLMATTMAGSNCLDVTMQARTLVGPPK